MLVEERRLATVGGEARDAKGGLMKRWTMGLATIALVASACGASEATSTPTSTPDDGLVIALSTAGGTVDGPIEVTVTLTNNTDSAVTLVRPTKIPNFVGFRVTDAEGSRMPFYGPQDRLTPLGDDGFVTVAPGESTREVLDLGPGYQLDEGTYSVTAEYRNPAGGSHQGTRAIVFEPGEGPSSGSIELVVSG